MGWSPICRWIAIAYALPYMLLKFQFDKIQTILLSLFWGDTPMPQVAEKMRYIKTYFLYIQ